MDTITTIEKKIEEGKSFVLEAGAGSGKTYTLIQTINYLLETKGDQLQYNHQHIVCITYTNVAKNEIIDRLENNPLVLVSTIHEFLWDCIKSFNKQLIVQFDTINTTYQVAKPDKYQLELIDRLKSVEYNDRKYSDFENGKVGHDDLVVLAYKMFENYELLTTIIAEKYPYILVDEYQDTAEETAKSLIDYLLSRNKKKVLLGFYGDSYQKIYDTGVGSLHNYVNAKKIDIIPKDENYRCSESVVELLNKVRSNITQIIPEGTKQVKGSIEFINCQNYPAQGGLKKLEYEKSLVPKKNENYDSIIEDLKNIGWDFSKGSDDKILIIANRRVAERGGFGELYSIYARRYGQGAAEASMKRENPLTSFFIGSRDKKTSKERPTGIEHLVSFYENKEYNNLMLFLKRSGTNGLSLKKHKDKETINKKIAELITERETKTVKEVFDFVIENKLASPSLGLSKFLEKLNVSTERMDDEQIKRVERNNLFYNSIMALPYNEFIQLYRHTQEMDIFSTKHGTKGEEYRNVLIVIDDTHWKQNYNFQNFISDTEADEKRKLRTKNLFYVACSRAKENLVILSLSTMEVAAMNNIKNWFGVNNVSVIA
jgi:DNA helicase-2/ATP-dependent DNA helicase PcrA